MTKNLLDTPLGGNEYEVTIFFILTPFQIQ